MDAKNTDILNDKWTSVPEDEFHETLSNYHTIGQELVFSGNDPYYSDLVFFQRETGRCLGRINYQGEKEWFLSAYAVQKGDKS